MVLYLCVVYPLFWSLDKCRIRRVLWCTSTFLALLGVFLYFHLCMGALDELPFVYLSSSPSPLISSDRFISPLKGMYIFWMNLWDVSLLLLLLVLLFKRLRAFVCIISNSYEWIRSHIGPIRLFSTLTKETWVGNTVGGRQLQSFLS